ncbi:MULTISPECIES: restriction system-associated AAA family ATPase [Pedobacter]|uniref:restriction system-associated AAA family ATPase n=1 Tax=Pedobacter TaxID=84567 RepID=UPI00103CCDAE|nr:MULTISPECIES: restriction system-associated AAA family ATPase [Pedobacter]
MKILRLKIHSIAHRPLLDNLELFFNPEEKFPGENSPNCFIGVNGSGKSQVLETIAEIFYYLDKLYGGPRLILYANSPSLFELDYVITFQKKEYLVEIKQLEIKAKAPKITITHNGKEIEWFVETFKDFLPSKIIGYTSGANETLSFPFMDYYDEYADYTAKRAFGNKDYKEDYDPRFYLMDYTTNIGVVIANLLYPQEKNVASVLKVIGIKNLKSFQLVIQTKHSAAPQKGIRLTEELQTWIESLVKVASCYEYVSSENRYVLDFYNDPSTRDAIKLYFKHPIDFYTALYKIELLNNLIIDDNYLKEIKRKRRLRKSMIKNPSVQDKDKVLNYSEIKLGLSTGQVINYLELSDGQHQYMNVFGTILMTGFENALYLLDEPETHFNPKWRREFIQILNTITLKRKQDFFLTSHSPFIVADSRKEKVFIFKRDTKKLIVKQPDNETYGSNSDYILKMAFGMESTIAEKSLLEIQKLQKSTDIDKIESEINDFGESAEKFYLLRRIEELKSEE